MDARDLHVCYINDGSVDYFDYVMANVHVWCFIVISKNQYRNVTENTQNYGGCMRRYIKTIMRIN